MARPATPAPRRHELQVLAAANPGNMGTGLRPELAKPPFQGWRPLCVYFAGLALMATIVTTGARPSRETEIAASHIRTNLGYLLQSGLPHPLGSAENEHLRSRLVGLLEKYGYQPFEQTKLVCTANTCATVHNVIARLPGQSPDAVLLSAHHDSVEVSPGASDDGIGVATALEIARELKLASPPRRSVIFLFSDAEEAGLLGARAFVQSPLWADVTAAFNLDSRGTSGRPLLFETAPGNRSLLEIYSRSAHYPATSSLFQALYGMLDNDTDFSVLKTKPGIQGLNLANISGQIFYHTPLDNLGHVSTATVEQLYDTTAAIIRAQANAAPGRGTTGDAVFFDVLGRFTILWPETMTFPLGVCLLVLNAVVFWMAFRRGEVRWPAIQAGAAAIFSSVALSGVGGLALRWGMRVAQFRFVEGDKMAQAACCTALAAGALTAMLFRRKVTLASHLLMVSAVWAILAVFVPAGASYLFLIPGATAVISALAVLAGRSRLAVLPVTALVTAVLWLPLLFLIYEGLGSSSLPIVAVVCGLMLTPLQPLLCSASRRAARYLAYAAIAAVFLTTAAALQLEERQPVPRPLNAIYIEHAGESTASLIVSGETDGLSLLGAGLAESRTTRVEPLPWVRIPGLSLRVNSGHLQPPEVAVISNHLLNGNWQIQLRLRSSRGAGGILVPPGVAVRKATVQGQVMPQPSRESLSHWNGWRKYSLLTLTREGAEFTFDFAAGSPTELYAADWSSTLSDVARPILAKFGTSQPFDSGHLTMLIRKVVISPPHAAENRPKTQARKLSLS
jgi:hypothetical protein